MLFKLSTPCPIAYHWHIQGVCIYSMCGELLKDNYINMFNEKLKMEKIVFDEMSKNNQGFHKKPMLEVVNYLREYKTSLEPKAVAYNSDVVSFICDKENTPDEIKDYLDTEVYLSQKFLREEAKAKHVHEMADLGYIPCREWKGYTGKAILIFPVSIDWFTGKIDKSGKIIETEDGGFFIPKGKRSRGYYLHNLEEAFYKAIN